MKIQIKVDGTVFDLTLEELLEEFSWHNMRDSNHCRQVRRKIFEAVVELAKASHRDD